MILSLSGGLDSSCLLFEFKDRIELAVSFKYPAKNNERELKSAVILAKQVGVPHKVIDLTSAFDGFKSALLNSSGDTPIVPDQAVVPFRNGIFLSILAGLAESSGCQYIALDNHYEEDDSNNYPDCTEEFSQAMGQAIELGTYGQVKFFRPYSNITKGELVLRGIKAGLDPNLTYSCYIGGVEQCGSCPTCLEREVALNYAYSKTGRL